MFISECSVVSVLCRLRPGGVAAWRRHVTPSGIVARFDGGAIDRAVAALQSSTTNRPPSVAPVIVRRSPALRHSGTLAFARAVTRRDDARRPRRSVVFDESANEFFEADYIIVVRDECGYSDEDENEECSGCGACERYQEQEPGALSPPEGYKDMGLFNRDGTLREQAWWEAGDVLLVGERSGTVFTPQHLQLLRRLQRERMLRSAICADCDAHAALHQPLGESYINVLAKGECPLDLVQWLYHISRSTTRSLITVTAL
ncbi:hypothetical protein RR46_08355 [Papilio xuthus]|uniref:Uncharacterized protein n=1 Tax=Papilio xuthus TaxID=66420 RepID=A0A194PGU7_PAPXU|nr:hypothetical protein RR46_08355 [Papilio xuthus]